MSQTTNETQKLVRSIFKSIRKDEIDPQYVLPAVLSVVCAIYELTDIGVNQSIEEYVNNVKDILTEELTRIGKEKAKKSLKDWTIDAVQQ